MNVEPPLRRTMYRCEGRPMRAYSATCGTCGRSEVVKCNSFRTTHGNDDEVELRFVKRRLFGLYWRIGKTETQNRCPKCMAAIIAASKYKKARERLMTTTTPKANGQPPPPKLAEQVPQATPHAAKPREMSRDDRRVIFEKLNEVYDRDRYSGGWSDSRVANDLGVPRAWVSNLRLEFFGDDGGSEEAKKLLDEAQRVLDDAKKLGTEVGQQLRVLALQFAHLEKRIDELSK